MKKLLLSFIILFALHSATDAQNIVIYDKTGSTVITGDTLTFWFPEDPAINESALDFDATNFARVVNNAPFDLTIKLKRRAKSFIPGSEDYACWGANCYGPNDPSVTPVWDINDQVPTSSGDTAAGLAPLQLYFDANNNTGVSVYDYVFYDVNNANDSAVLHLKWFITTLTDINEISEAVQNMKVYPNPAIDQFTIDLNAGIQADDQEIIVRDMLGKLVQREQLNASQEEFTFSTAGMNGGIYFVSYVLEGEVLKTSKLVVR